VSGGRKNFYLARLKKELGIPEEEILGRVRWDIPLLAENAKCSVSLDLPVLNCQPTEACSEVCYGSQGRQVYHAAVVKSLAVNRMISEAPERAARKIVDEAAGRTIRLAGSGDLLPEYRAMAEYVVKYGGEYWGFTRRVDTHKFMPELMFSIDATTPARVLEYVQESVPARRRTYLRRPGDPEPTIEVAVTFPVHGPQTKWTEYVPEDRTDCPGVRKRVEGCYACRRCY
jgi:hypothetical protein